MIKVGEPNPLNIFNLRRMEYCGPHLEQVFFDCKVHDKIIIDWIYEHLEGRFYFNDSIVQDNGNFSSKKCAAFEIPSEASYFCFMLETINKSTLGF